jgi:hypothetical protein
LSVTGSGRVAIYSDNNGRPGTLLCQSDPENIKKGWTDFNIPKISLDNDTTYWVAFWLKLSGNIFYYSFESQSGIRLEYPSDVNSLGFPENFPSGGEFTDFKWNIRIRENAIYPPSLSADNRNDTAWRSLPGQSEVWCAWDLGSSRQFDGVRIYWCTDTSLRPSNFIIQVSDKPDGPWQNVLNVTEQPSAGDWNDYFFPMQEKRYIRVWSTSQMGICEIEYYSPLTVSLSVDPCSIRFENFDPFGTCIVFDYILKIYGMGKASWQWQSVLGSYTVTRDPATAYMKQVGTMWYSRRYGLLKDKYHRGWGIIEDSNEKELFSEDDTVTLQSATLSD